LRPDEEAEQCGEGRQALAARKSELVPLQAMPQERRLVMLQPHAAA
jgi:hypothetical protein